MALKRTFYDILDDSQWIEIPGISAFELCWDGMPVSPGHMLIISRDSKYETYFDLVDSSEEDHIRQLHSCIQHAKLMITAKFGEPDGWNIGMNCGKHAGQSIMHFHCHVIPRWAGDMDDPLGGVRHVIPEKGNYKMASEIRHKDRFFIEEMMNRLSSGGQSTEVKEMLADWLREIVDKSGYLLNEQRSTIISTKTSSEKEFLFDTEEELRIRLHPTINDLKL